LVSTHPTTTETEGYDVTEARRERANELIQRLNDSAHFPLRTFESTPNWLRATASQILALTGDARIIHAGHTLDDYEIPSFQESPDVAVGTVQVLTENLLVTAAFSASEVRTTVVPLRKVESVTITRVRDVHDNTEIWPDRVAFEVNIAGTTVRFPGSKMASPRQQAELPAALAAVLAATMNGK
jgi:hypothetical protein